ncbi:MAG TPA: thioesterase family protein [Rhodocyclaceae bacterium]|nr:thioesterase family protein [Rhodocyclaceae bacterium]
MKEGLRPGLEHELRFTVTEGKTVPALYPESPSFQDMPEVLATGYLVGLLEWACLELVKPYLDWPREQTVGTRVDFSHTAATPPGFTVTVKARLEEVDGRRLVFSVSAHDGVDAISSGRHERFVIDAAKFRARVAEKKAKG